ncbi:hypothetical protein [Dehalobacter sp. TBBPA1]
MLILFMILVRDKARCCEPPLALTAVGSADRNSKGFRDSYQ